MLAEELERLTGNAGSRRADLLNSALRKSRRRKILTIIGGILALTSAATLTAFVTRLFGTDGMQTAAALISLMSGTISLVAAAFYADDEIVGRLAGASKYLALRDAIYRLAIDPDLTDKQKRRALAALQSEYANLDTNYSKFYTIIGTTSGSATASSAHLIEQYLTRSKQQRMEDEAASEDINQLWRYIDHGKS